jgi:hypothetical protein
LDQISRQRWQSVGLVPGRAIFDQKIPAFNVASLETTRWVKSVTLGVPADVRDYPESDRNSDLPGGRNVPKADIRPKHQFTCVTAIACRGQDVSLWVNEAGVFALSGESARFNQNNGGTENGEDNFS